MSTMNIRHMGDIRITEKILDTRSNRNIRNTKNTKNITNDLNNLRMGIIGITAASGILRIPGTLGI